MAEDIAIRAGMLIGKSYHRTTRRFRGIGFWLAPAWEIVADAPPCQFLQQQAGDVSPAVKTHIDKERGVVILGQVTAVKFRKACW